MPALQREAAWAEERLLGLRFRGPGRRSLGAKSQKSLKKVSKKVSRPGAPKVWKKSRKRSEKSPRTHFQTFFLTFRAFFETFSDFSGRETFFETFLRLFGFWPRDSFSQVHGTSILGAFWQSFLQNGRVHLHIIEKGQDREEKNVHDHHRKKIFGELFWPQKKNFQAGGRYENPRKTRKTTSTTEIFLLCPPFFCKEKFLTGAGRFFLSGCCRNRTGTGNWNCSNRFSRTL